MGGDRLSGKVALVRGAGRGMGAAIAERFAEHGAAVCVNDADADLARSKAAALRARGARAIHHAGSVTDLL